MSSERLPKQGSVEALVVMTSSPSSSCSRYLAIGYMPSEISLMFEPTHDLTLGSERRAKEARQYVLSLLKRLRIRSWKEDEEVRASIPHDAVDRLPGLVFEIDAALDAFRKQRLHPRVVEEILGITARERRLWTKDGRLPQSGSGSFWSGRQLIYFPLHPVQRLQYSPSSLT